MFNRLTAATVALCAIAHSVSPQVASQIIALTGGQRTRLAWVEGGTRLFGGGAIKGFDTETGAVTTILTASNRQNKPIICSGGYRVVVTRDYQVYVVNWDGTGLRSITSGICSDVWQDPATGLEWAVVRTGSESSDNPIYRYLIDDPSQSKLLWDRSKAGDEYMNWYQVSADGKRAVDFLPWDRAFVIDSGGLVANGFHTNLSRGCWSTLASDNSYHWVNLPLTGLGHAAFNVFRDKDTVITQLPITAPKPAGTTDECYHPRFASNGGRFICLTRGYLGGGESDQCEVYLGKFNAAYDGFDGWVRVTDNMVRDYTPDAWVGVAAPSPSMRFSPDSLAFAANEGGPDPAAQQTTVSTPYAALQGLSVSDNAGWLTVSASQGASDWTVTSSVSVSGLASGVHRATVTVSATGAVPPVRTFGVKVTVNGTPVASSIRITPRNTMVVAQNSTQLSATVYDQMEQAMSPQPGVSWSVASGPAGATVSNGLVTAGTALGLCRVVAAVGGVHDTAEVAVVEFIPVHIKVNCGDQSLGYVPGWEGDQQFLVPGHIGSWWPDDPGNPVDFSAVTNPPPRDIYVRYRGGAVWYDFPSERVPAGSYRVRLHFWEPYNDNPVRAIDCTIEGTQVMNDMRILAEAGGVKFKAVVKEYDVTVNGDGLQMQLGGTSPMILGMEVISSGSLAKAITLLEPLGGQTYQVGEVLTVRWSALPSVSGVGIELSPNNGENWYLIVDTTIANGGAGWGAYRWTVAPTVGSGVPTTTDQVLVKVYQYTNSTIYDASTAPVTIVPALVVVSQVAGVRGGVAVRRLSGRLVVDIGETGAHVVELFALDGTVLRRLSGHGRSSYVVHDESVARSCVVVRVRAGGREILAPAVVAR